MRLAVLAGGAVILAVAGVVAVVVTRGDGSDQPSAAAFEGTWDVSLVVGAVDAEPGADPASFPTDATFRERWVFDDCDDDGCTLHRPDEGLLLGDLDEVPFAFATTSGLDDAERFVGEGGGAEAGPPADDDDHADPCAGTAARRFTARIEVGVRDRVLSGTVLRRPEARQVAAGGVTCYGLDLTLGFSGIPAADV